MGPVARVGRPGGGLQDWGAQSHPHILCVCVHRVWAYATSGLHSKLKTAAKIQLLFFINHVCVWGREGGERL